MPDPHRIPGTARLIVGPDAYQEIAHEPKGTDCLNSRAWKATGNEVEMDCGCFVPLPHIPTTDYYDGRDGSIEDDDEDRIADAAEAWRDYLEFQRTSH